MTKNAESWQSLTDEQKLSELQVADETMLHLFNNHAGRPLEDLVRLESESKDQIEKLFLGLEISRKKESLN